MRGPATTITAIATGLSGAGVYRVETGGQTFVLKVSDEREGIAGWRRAVYIQQTAAAAGLAPPVIHVEEARRAVVSAYVTDRSFPALYADPRTRESALVQLGQTVRRVHALPLLEDAGRPDPRELLGSLWSGIDGSVAIPAFVGEAIRDMLAEQAPPRERALVTSHNDLNPTNLIYDGERILLLDWNAAGPNDPFYDLAAAAMFLRMDDGSCRRLLAAYDSIAATELPAGFVYLRRLVAVLCGTMFLHLARQSGYAGESASRTLDSTASLGECHQRMRSGSLSVLTADGQWTFGLALVKEGARMVCTGTS
jgi:thiamine kinase-like enzyme